MQLWSRLPSRRSISASPGSTSVAAFAIRHRKPIDEAPRGFNPFLEAEQMKQETGWTEPPTGLVEHPLLLAFGAAAAALVAVGSGYAAFALLQ